MRIHHYLSCTEVNGPGKRFALWTQGCSRNCKGCFNPQTHDKGKGIELPVNEIMKMILPYVDGITVSGGEPFEQEYELAELLELASLRKIHRLVYTGYRYEDLKRMKSASVEKCLLFTNMLIDGRYDHHRKQKHPLAGSGNQRVLILESGKIFQKMDIPREEKFRISELTIDRSGNISATGFMNSGFLNIQ